MVQLGREGYRAYARDIFTTADAMKAVVVSHPELRMIGSPTFCFSFTSDAFDIYHVADSMRGKGWRFNGQQYPNAIHMAVTRPQTRRGWSTPSPPISPRAWSTRRTMEAAGQAGLLRRDLRRRPGRHGAWRRRSSSSR